MSPENSPRLLKKPEKSAFFASYALAKTAMICSLFSTYDSFRSTAIKGIHTMATTATPPTVTMKNIAADLAEKHEQPKKQMNEIMDDMITHIVKNLKKGNRIRIAGLGILQVRKRAARMGRNPATGEAISIPAKKKIAFRPAKELKDAVGK